MSWGYSGCVVGFCEASRTKAFAAVAPKHSGLLAFSRSAFLSFVCDEAAALQPISIKAEQNDDQLVRAGLAITLYF